ncbi:MAG: phosphotransferase KptA/Tpt1 [Polyangiaceae bacterium]|nr:phosphotransferase KptA/Tpt1 [Polyangiaceae bacterium]
MKRLADQHKSISKFLSLVLRHEPGAIGIALDPNGWVSVEKLLDALAAHGKPLARAELEEVVATSDKRRFAFNSDGSMIRANQGHSVDVDLGLRPMIPPDILYHGTVPRYVPSIRAHGLVKGKRHHVHLSATRELAIVVGKRRGEPYVFQVDTRGMVAAGLVFYRSENGVWLTDHVPARFLDEDSRAG